MDCPNGCCENSEVKDSRKRNGTVYRRRKCSECGAVFTTYEISDSRHTYLVEAAARLHRLASLVGEISRGYGGPKPKDL